MRVILVLLVTCHSRHQRPNNLTTHKRIQHNNDAKHTKDETFLDAVLHCGARRGRPSSGARDSRGVCRGSCGLISVATDPSAIQ